ncbi:MAG: DnaD domain protein [Ruminiclostridium sp.]|nr:DnaD domain protein [Ruminiclostridium sp.]
MMADICRKVRRRSFTQIDNEPINNTKLRYEDIGLLAYVMSKPDNWTIYKADLVTSHANGRESVNSILKRLQEYGYLMVVKGRTGKGNFTYNQYIFSDHAFDFGDEYELGAENTTPDVAEYGSPANPCQTEVSSVDGKPSTGSRRRETVDGFPTTNNTIYNNTINNNIINNDADEDEQKIINKFHKLFGTNIPVETARVLLEHTEEEIEFIFKILQEKKEQGKIVSPKGILVKDTRSVINRIFAGEFYQESDPEIDEFQKTTGIRIKGQSQRSLYKQWRKKFSKEMMFKAGELTALHSKNGTIDYMDAVLKDWEKRNINKPEQIKAKKKESSGYEIFMMP